MKLGDIWVKLGLQKEGFDKGIDDAKKKTSSFGDNMKKIGGMIAGVFAANEIWNFAKQSVAAYDTAAKAEQALLTALKGRVSVQQALIKQAVELQGKTLFSDDETTRAQSLLAAFIKEESQIKALIPLIQDFATAKQMDLGSAADLVTKTFAGQMNALGRYGIQVEGSAGSTERLTMIQKGLNDAFGGQAEAAAKVGTGALKILANEYDNLQEVIGKLIISQQNQSGSLTKVLTSATKGITSFFQDVSTFSDAGFSFTESIVAAFGSSREDIDKLSESLVVSNEVIADTNKELKDPEPVKTAKQRLDAIIAQNKAIQEEIDSIRILKQELKGESVSPISPIGTPSNVGKTTIDTDALANMDSHYKMVAEKHKKFTEEYLEDEKQFNEDLNTLIQSGMADAASALGEGIGSMITGDMGWSDFGKTLLGVVGKFMVQFGQLVIGYALAAAGLEAAIKMPGAWPVALAAGVALVAIGSAISNLSSKGLSGSSSGAMSGGGGVAKGYSQSSYNNSNGVAALTGNVTFELRGTILQGVLNNTNRKNSIIG